MMISMILRVGEDEVDAVNPSLYIRGFYTTCDLLASVNRRKIKTGFTVGNMRDQFPLISSNLDPNPRLEHRLGGAKVQRNVYRFTHAEYTSEFACAISQFNPDEMWRLLRRG